MINNFNADQARANSEVVEQVTFEFLLNDLLTSAENMSKAKYTETVKDYLTKQLYPALIDEVLEELEKRKFKTETYPLDDGKKFRFKLSW
ncbi:TPA: hypothetical protein R7O47_000309 [Acinetobacter baumannii]|nr:hypothetical protein [Acinetobacter baumannii]